MMAGPSTRFGRPASVSILVYFGLVALCVAMAGRPFLYSLDDAYIHLALARTLAETGVWGVQPHDPAAASSSPLWTLLLAAIAELRVPAICAWSPLVLNMAFGAGLIGLWARLLRRYASAWGEAWTALALIVGVVLAGLPALALIGMEHTLHLLLATALVWATADSIAAEPADGKSIARPLLIGLLAGLAVAARYESLFLAAPLIVIAGVRRRFGVAAALAVGAVTPVLGFGLYWASHGGWLLPNALLLKAVAPAQISGMAAALLGVTRNLSDNLVHRVSLLCLGCLMVLAAALAALEWRRRRDLFDPRLVAVAVVIVATGLQVGLASLGWLFRYEAWLIGLGLGCVATLASPAMARAAAGGLPSWRVWAAAGGVALAVVGYRGVRQTVEAVLAVDDRRDEHLSVAHFLAQNYPAKPVAVNDVGLVAMYGRAPFLDIFGLADNAPIRLRRAGAYGPAQVAELARERHAAIAVLQICWSEVWLRAPSDWRLVEVWRMPRNVVFGDRDVGFFALSPGEAAALQDALRRSPPPAAVTVLRPAPEAWPTYLKAARSGGSSPRTTPLCRTAAGPH